MIGARQSIGHMTVGGHPTNLDVWSVTVHLSFVGVTAYQSQRWH